MIWAEGAFVVLAYAAVMVICLVLLVSTDTRRRP
jgi:hypothetical protein